VNINYIAKKHWKWVEGMKWHNKTWLECMALVASEVGEAIQEVRRDAVSKPKLGEELADIILRTLDLMIIADLDPEGEIIRKMDINQARGTRGRKF